jgi:hypothetical protein
MNISKITALAGFAAALGLSTSACGSTAVTHTDQAAPAAATTSAPAATSAASSVKAATTQTPAAQAAASCSDQISAWAKGPGYNAMKTLDVELNYVYMEDQPTSADIAPLTTDLAAVIAHPVPQCLIQQSNGDWASLLSNTQSGITNLKAGNLTSASSAIESASMTGLNDDASAAGYGGAFPSS